MVPIVTFAAAAVEARPPARQLPAGRPPVSPRRGAPSWVPEVEGLTARALFELPVPPTLTISVPGVPAALRITRDTGEDGLVFDPDEWSALVVATEADRVWPRDLVELCRRKAAEPGHRVTLPDALEGAQPDPRERWDVSRVLARWGASLVGVR